MKFSERLKELRLEKNLSQEQLSHETGLSQSSITKWEREERDPTLKALIALADFFQVTIDYLAGREN